MAQNTSGPTSAGLTTGAVIAGIMSWTKVHSILWFLFHAFFGWLYVIYHVIYQDY